MIAKVGVAVIGAILLIPLLIASGVSGAISAIFGSGSSQPSATAPADIPADYLALYRAAAGVCPGLDWTILAAIGKIESNHGRLQAPGVTSGENGWGAGGPMQFEQPSFEGVLARHRIPPGGASPPSRYDPHDAIYAASFFTDQLFRVFVMFVWSVDSMLVHSFTNLFATSRGTGPRPVGGGWCGAAAAGGRGLARADAGAPWRLALVHDPRSGRPRA